MNRMPLTHSLVARAARPCVLSLVLLAAAHAAPATRPANDALRIERSLAQLQSGDWMQQWEAMHDLSVMKHAQAVGPIRAILDSSAHPFVRSRALVALARIQGPAVLDRAIQFGIDPDPVFREAAAESLGLIADSKGLAAIEMALQDQDAKVRNEALIAYARLRKAAAWPLVGRQISDKSYDLVMPAIRASIHIGTEESWNKLLELLDSKTRDYRLATAAVLGESCNSAAIRPLLNRLAVETDKSTAARITNSLALFEYADLAEPLLAALDGNQPSLYPVALTLLAMDPTKTVCDRVAGQLPRLEQHAPASLAGALKMLTRFDADAYAKVFVPYMEHSLPEVRKAAIDGLGRTAAKGVDYYALLQPRLADADKAARAAAYQALRRTTRGAPKGGIVEYLKKPLESAEPAIHTPALELLRERLTRMEVPAALSALDRFLATGDKETRKLAASILEGAGDERTFDLVARAQGYPSPWMVVGPFEVEPPAENGNGNGESVFPPEQEINLSKIYEAGARKVAWALVQGNRTDGLVDLTYIYTQEDEKGPKGIRVAYGTVNLVADADTTATLAVTGRSASAIWLNGQKVADEKREEYTLQAPLKTGMNTLLVKVSSADPRMWYYRVQVLDKDGQRLAGVTSAVPVQDP